MADRYCLRCVGKCSKYAEACIDTETAMRVGDDDFAE